MSFRKNIAVSYASQIYVTLAGILILPLYLQYMGAEAYGLVGFFTMLQVCFNLLDMGLTPTVARETARFKGGVTDALSYRRLLRAMQLIFFLVALLGGGIMFVSSEFIATAWLKVQTLPLTQVQMALQLMAVGVVLRWMSGLYRGCISGLEQLVWLSGFNMFVATLRFVSVLPILIWVGHSPAIFFTYQLLVATIELVGLVVKAYSLFPVVPKGTRLGWSPASLFVLNTSVLKFSLTIAFTSSVWVLVTQTDKLVLSGILPLTEYGYFTLAVLVASGIMIISGPISNVIMPRMTILHAEGKREELIRVYSNSTQLVSIIAGSAAITLALCSVQLLFAWTGDLQLAKKAAPIMRLYAIGNGFLAVAAFPYYLQYAKGNLQYHLLGNACMVVVLIPSIFLAAKFFGGLGAGYVWLTVNGLLLFTWVAYVHHKLEPGIHKKWILNDVLKIIMPTTVVSLLAANINIAHATRAASLLQVIVIGSLALMSGLICSSVARNMLLNVYVRKFK